MKLVAMVVVGTFVAACGSNPPPKTDAPIVEVPNEATRKSGPKLQTSQELGSIDQRKVEQTFAGLQSGRLAACHKQGRDRIEFLTGDVKVFLRIDGNGRVRYAFFEDSTLGDRETEKCILSVFSNTNWPKPEGGEAEVRSGFGWGAGGEREPTNWPSDKVIGALADAKDVKKAIDKCKAGVNGDFHVTAYVEVDEGGRASADPSSASHPPDSAGKGKPAAKQGPPSSSASKEPGGRFKGIGMAATNKEAAAQVDCMIEALKGLALPSPGSSAAKVTFSL